MAPKPVCMERLRCSVRTVGDEVAHHHAGATLFETLDWRDLVPKSRKTENKSDLKLSSIHEICV
jgi:hypothetical protein